MKFIKMNEKLSKFKKIHKDYFVYIKILKCIIIKYYYVSSSLATLSRCD